MTTSVAPAPVRPPQQRRPDRVTLASERRSSARRIRAFKGLLMVLPLVGGLALFQAMPLALAMSESLQAFNPMTHLSNGFVGLANFTALFADPLFWQAVRNTLVVLVAMTTVELVAAFGIALLINRKLRGRVFAQAAVIGALAAAESVMAILWFVMYNRDTGLVNAMLGVVSLGPVSWLTSEDVALISVILVAIWKDIGLPVLILLAALQSVDESLYDAVALDGANAWQSFRHVTLPSLRRETLVALFMITLAAVKVFTPILLMTQGGPNGATTNLIYYAYQRGFQMLDYGVGSAATVCMVLLLAVVTVVQALALRERDR